MSVISVVMIGLDIYPVTVQEFLKLVVLFEINTMIDFVRFDTVRNEIVIGDQTLYIINKSTISW